MAILLPRGAQVLKVKRGDTIVVAFRHKLSNSVLARAAKELKLFARRTGWRGVILENATVRHEPKRRPVKRTRAGRL